MDAMRPEPVMKPVKLSNAQVPMNNVKKAIVSISARISYAKIQMNIAEEANACLWMPITTICMTNMKHRPTKAKIAANMPIAIPPMSPTDSVTALSAINARPNAHRTNNV